MTEPQEKKNQRIAMLTSIGVHAGLFLLFFFMVAWRAPNPPLPEYGIELNFGLDQQGSGEVQPKTPVGSEGTQEEEPEQPEPEEAKPEEAKPVETQPKPVEQEVVSKEESPVTVKEKEKKEEVKQPEKAVEKVTEPKKEVVNKPDPNAAYKPSKPQTESTNKTTEGKEGTAGNHGDDKGKTGDKGDPQGSLDADALYGKKGGGGGGPSLELSGWAWDDRPNPDVPNNESGRVVFEIKVDDNGDIVSIRTLERSVSAEAEQVCRRAVEKLTFTKTGSNVPPISTGKITFVIRAR